MGREVASKVLDGINDLVIMAPIREGFIEAYEPVTYATRMRIISEALNDIRLAAREYEKGTPFADASERILSLLDFKAGIIDNDLLQFDAEVEGPNKLKARRYFYLIATFDGVWEPYMRLIWHPLGSLLDLLFSNCEGYVYAKDNSFEDYMNWIRSAQVDSAVFFTTTGVTVSDQIYLRKLEKLQREQDPSVGDLAIARTALENPGATAEAFRVASPQHDLLANRLALEALGVFYRLSDYYPPLPDFALSHLPEGSRSEAFLLQRAVHLILEGWNYRPLKELLDAPIAGLSAELRARRATLERFRVLIDWFATGALPDGTSAFPSLKPPVAEPLLDQSEVQRGVLTGFGGNPARRLRHGAMLLLTVSDPQRAPDFIAHLLDTGQLAFEGEDCNPDLYRTLGFTRSGLERLRVKRSTIDAFPKEFREGLHVRAPQLGDVWDNHPRNWSLPQRLVPLGVAPTIPLPPVEMEEIDLVLVLRHNAPHDLDDGGAAVAAEVDRLVALAAGYGVEAVAVEAMENHYDPDDRFRDHFGFRDNFSQPKPSATAERVLANRIGTKRDDALLGEVLCGYSSDRQDVTPLAVEETIGTTANQRLGWGAKDRTTARGLQKNGSYLVIRKMCQDVAAFNKFIADNASAMGGDASAIAAKLVGRHPDGQSLVDPAKDDYNDFDYAQDSQGNKCPFAAHIRRANPRAVEHGRPSPRLLRCGMSYGPRFAPGADGADSRPRGLMFMAYNSSIAEQYETIQRWLNGGNSTGVASTNNDPLTGTAPRPDGKRTYRFEADGKVVRAQIDRPFVRLEWGLYTFVPSRSALRKIGKPEYPYFELNEPLENFGHAVITRLENLPTALAKSEWSRALEDFDTKDFSQKEATPNIFSGIRYWRGGAVEVGGDITKEMLFNQPEKRGMVPGKVVIAGSQRLIRHVLGNEAEFTVEEQLRRLNRSSGPIYVAEQSNDQYDDPSLTSNYKRESEGTNAVIHAYGEEEGYEHGYAAGKAVLDWLIRDATFRHQVLVAAGSAETEKPEFKLELGREYVARALAWLNRTWFGLPDGGFHEDGTTAEFMGVGEWDWRPASQRMSICPGDGLAVARQAFQPRSNPVWEAFAEDQGKAIKQAGIEFADRYFAEGYEGEVPGLISSAMAQLPEMDKGLAAQNVIGIMLGTTPPMNANLRGLFFDWLSEQTLWRYQAELHRQTGGRPATYEQANAALRGPLSVAMCKRPSPEIMYRTCKGPTKDGGDVVLERWVRPDAENRDIRERDDIKLAKGDLVILPLACATQRAISESATDPNKLEQGVHVIFGGERGSEGAPIHACPGRKLAMGGMLGIVAAFLDVGRIQAQPAGLIVRVSDWS